MTGNIVILGDRLYSGNWEKTNLKDSLLAKVILTYEKPILPEIKELNGTAYVDLENESFCSLSFLQKLASSFDKLKIVGVSDSISEKQTIKVAKPGVSEILNKKEYQKR